jgi:hypothetical protein
VEEEMMELRVALAITLFLLLILVIPIHVESQVLHYSEVIHNWFDWVIELDIYTPATFTLGSIANVSISMNLREKGQGSQLCITSVSLSLASISVSRYVGFLRNRGDHALIAISIPLSSTAYPQSKPGSTLIDVLKITLQGYVELANGSRKAVSFTKTVPVNIYVPPSNVIAYMDYSYITNGVQLIVRLQNFDVHPVYNVYLSIYVNSSQRVVQYYAVLEPQSQTSFQQLLFLGPGLYSITAIVNYTTSYGINKSFLTSTIIIVPTTPKVSIKANTTEIVFGQQISIEGFIEPKAPLGFVLEYSLNGFDWYPIASLEFSKNGSLRYAWKPSLVGTMYVRGRTIETERFREAVSNTVTIRIAKLKPSVRISTEKNLLAVGDNTRLTVTITPNTSIPIIVVYRRQGEPLWRNYTTLTMDPSGRAVIPTQFFSDPGTYIFKAIALETGFTTQSESNEIAINVQIPANQTTPLPQSSAPPRVGLTALVVAVSISMAIALLLFAGGRRKTS